MPRFRYIGEAPGVRIPDMLWGDDDNPVRPGDISESYDGPISSEVIVPLGSKEEAAWLDLHPEFKPAKKGGDA